MKEFKLLFLTGGLIKPVRGLVNLIAGKFFPRLYTHCLEGVGPLSTF